MKTATDQLSQPGPATGTGSVGTLTLTGTLQRAETLLERFLALMAGVPYDNAGIPMSEMFFLLGALGDAPGRILESGRGGGQSTAVLGHWFSAASVISVEENDRSPKARAAVERLAPLANVDCRFGDSRQLLPALLESGDAVLIDGPKEFRALKLAFELLATGRPQVVFIHDLHVDSPARRFLDAYVPFAFCSDEPAFVARYAHLDTLNGAQPKEHWIKTGGRGYGPTLACIPGGAVGDRDYGGLLRRLRLARAVSHARDKLRHLFRRQLPMLGANIAD